MSKEFMLLFRMPPNSAHPTAEQMASMYQEWQKFIGGIASKGKLLSVSRLAFDGVTIKKGQIPETKICLENNLAISGNLSMKAESLEEVIDVAKLCPVLLVGGTVEVRPIMSMKP